MGGEVKAFLSVSKAYTQSLSKTNGKSFLEEMSKRPRNFATTEKELLEVVFSCDKFRSYVVDSKVIVRNDHAAIKFLWKRKMLNLDSLGGFSATRI